MPYEALDFYDVDSLLTEEERMVRDMVRDFVDEEVLPKIEEACRDGVFPDEWRVTLGEMGVLGAPLEGYGCPGLSYTAYGVICRELERGDSGLRSFASVQGSLAMYPIWDFGSEEQKQHYLPKMASVEFCPDDRNLCNCPVGNPHFCAVQEVVISHVLGLGDHIAGV